MAMNVMMRVQETINRLEALNIGFAGTGIVRSTYPLNRKP